MTDETDHWISRVLPDEHIEKVLDIGDSMDRHDPAHYDLRTLYITTASSVYRLKTKMRGFVPYMR